MVHRQGNNNKTRKRSHYPSPETPGSTLGPSMVSTKHVNDQASPVRQSPRKASTGSRTSGLLPTPLSQSPSRPSPSTSTLHYPPSFDPTSLHHTSSRYSAQQYTPFSPYRQSEYGRSGGLVVNANGGGSLRGAALPRSKVERRLFDEEAMGDDGAEGGKGRNRGSSPLAPAFEANMILRTGAPVDLISWLRKNFHHVPPAENPPIPPSSMSLLAIRKLLMERFPRVPEPEELAKSVSTAFPHSELDYAPAGSGEPPSIRGLVWHGADISAQDDRKPGGGPQTPGRSSHARKAGASDTNGNPKLDPSVAVSHSPTNSTLVSPTSSSAKQRLPNTPARSVLEEFADLATKTDKTPVPKTRSLPGEIVAPAPAYALANICNSFDITPAVKAMNGRKRARSKSPSGAGGAGRRRATTPDKLSDLLAAAEAVEGSPITSVLGHKRRRTIGGTGGMKDVMEYPKRNRQLARDAAALPIGRARGLTLPGVQEDAGTSGNGTHGGSDAEDAADAADTSVDLAFLDHSHTDSTASQKSLSTVSNALGPMGAAGAGGGSLGPSLQFIHHVPAGSGAMTPGGHSSASHPGTPFPPPTRLAPRQRKANELPTEGDNPGVDCKPPYPYHELIRHAIETAPEGRLQLSQIYASIAERFPFFKTLDEKKTSGWQNSIRHNLSLKKMFVRVNKVDGVPDEAGKGGWWTVQPGVPDEGRPGRKAKAKRKAHETGGEGSGSGDASVEGMSADGGDARSEIGASDAPPSYTATPNGHPPSLGTNGYANGNGSYTGTGSGKISPVEGREKAERWIKRDDGLGLGPGPEPDRHDGAFASPASPAESLSAAGLPRQQVP